MQLLYLLHKPWPYLGRLAVSKQRSAAHSTPLSIRNTIFLPRQCIMNHPSSSVHVVPPLLPTTQRYAQSQLKISHATAHVDHKVKSGLIAASLRNTGNDMWGQAQYWVRMLLL